MINTAKIEVTTEFDPLPEMKGDESKLLQAVINIIKNACEAMISIPMQERKITVSTFLDKEDDHYFICEVKDCGMGFDTETKEQLFNFGFTTKDSGLGFGLHACANDLFSMGGSLEAKSEGLNLGAQFILRMPFIQQVPDDSQIL